jgi:hypothetical protein
MTTSGESAKRVAMDAMPERYADLSMTEWRGNRSKRSYVMGVQNTILRV